MAHAPPERPGTMQRPVGWTVIALIGLRVLVVIVIATRAGALGSVDADVGRAFRIATSPAVPYRGFPVEFMPLQTLFDRLFAGGTLATAVIWVAVVAFAADVAAAAALWWGWGRRQATTYLLLGAPLLGFIYLRFDLVAVALVAWSLATLRRRREEPSGVLLGLAVMAKLWPIVLAIPFAMRRARRAVVLAAAVCLLLGAWWYLTGGAKGPFQVLSFRGARGWHVESVVGSLLWVAHHGIPYREADAVRIGAAATWAKALLFSGLVVVQALLWRRASRDRRDAFGAASLASVAALSVFAPVFSLQAAAWLLPFAALALEGEHDERHTGGVAAVAIVLTGLIALVWRDHATTPQGWVGWLVLARNLVWIDVVISWLRVPVIDATPEPDVVFRRRAADRAAEGIETVLPFDAE
jgi:glycosyl transferase family 87